MKDFNPNKLELLSPDADDWNELINEHQSLNQENAIYGVLLYPKKDISKVRCESEATYHIGSTFTYAEGGLDIIMKQRGENWAIIYYITAWYKHFDLPEQFD